MSRVRKVVYLLLVWGVGSSLHPAPVHGDFNLRSEFTNQIFNSTVRNKATGEETKSRFVGFLQRNNVFMSKSLYPYLSVRGGGNFEVDLSQFDSMGTSSEITETRLKPFGEITLDNPVYKAGFWYSQTLLNTDGIAGQDNEATLEEWSGHLGWEPSDILKVNGRYFQSHTQDDSVGIDLQEKRFLADMRCVPVRDVQFNYLYTNNRTTDLAQDVVTTEQTHNGRLEYARSFFNHRLLVNTSYNLQYLSLDLPGGANRFQLVPVPRSAGRSAVNSNPASGSVSVALPALIDGNLSASTGVDIGLGGDELFLTNLAVDLGTQTRVDTIHLWVDRTLSSTVSNSFTWSVYASPDNNDTSTWTLVATVVPAPFGPFENRFEIDFPETETRFIKVVTRPLSLTVPDAPSFPNIFVTEMEVFSSSSQEEDILHEDLAHNYTLNLRAKLGERTNGGYSFYFQNRDQTAPEETKRETSHGLYLTHQFDEMFSFSANASRTDLTVREENEEEDRTVSYSYTASLKATYLETLSQSLVYSGLVEEENTDTSVTNSVFLRNNADLFKGWTLFLDVGYLWKSASAQEEKKNNLIVRSGSEIRPNEKVTVTVNYNGLIDTSSSVGGSGTQNRLDLQAFVLPTRNVSLFGRIGIVDDRGPVQILQNYSLNWSPFQDGELQLLFTYSEILGTGDVTEERSFGPGLKWKIGLHAYFDFFYNRIRSENDTQITNSDSITAKLRIQF